MSSIEFDTFTYELSHGKSPRGRGSWAFCPFHLRNAEDYMTRTLWSPSMTFTEAKKWAKAQIAERISNRQTEGLPAAPWSAGVWAVLP